MRLLFQFDKKFKRTLNFGTSEIGSNKLHFS
jgi:hypothetical protein